MDKSCGVVVVVVAHVILVSALGPNPSFFLFGGLLFNLGACWDRGPDLELDQGLTIREHHFSKPGPLKAAEIERGKMLICLNNTARRFKGETREG